MSENVPAMPTPSSANPRSRGRAYLWAGIGVCVLGLVLIAVQFNLKYLFVPWYSPALATLGTAWVLISVTRRRSIFRILALVLVTVL
jgi:hypothetical protein